LYDINLLFPDKLDYLSITGKDHSWENDVEHVKINNLTVETYEPKPMSGLMQLVAYGGQIVNNNTVLLNNYKIPVCKFANFPKLLNFFELNNFFGVEEINKAHKIKLFYTKILNKNNITNLEKKMKEIIDIFVANDKINDSFKNNKKHKIIFSKQKKKQYQSIMSHLYNLKS